MAMLENLSNKLNIQKSDAKGAKMRIYQLS